MDDFDIKTDFRRATLFNKIDAAITPDQARQAADKVRQQAEHIPGRSLVSVSTIGGRHHVSLLVEDPLRESDAPPEYVDGVYVSVSRVNTLDSWLGPKKPQTPGP